jgi:hypothetical protein
MPALACAIMQTTITGQARAQDSLPPVAVVNASLDSLEQVALMSDSPDRRSAVVLAISGPGRWWMLTPGAEEPPSEIRYPGVVARLVRIYRASDEYSLRYSIISLLALQAERAAAAAFLEQVAVEEPPARPVPPPGVAIVLDDYSWPLQNEAVGALLYVGPPGRAALQRLYAKGTVRDPIAKATLEKFASEGFRDPRKQ